MANFLNVVLALPLLVLWGVALVDLVQRRDISRRARLVWGVAVVVLPYVGVFVYLFFRPRMALGARTSSSPADELVNALEAVIDRRATREIEPDLARDEIRGLLHVGSVD